MATVKAFDGKKVSYKGQVNNGGVPVTFDGKKVSFAKPQYQYQQDFIGPVPLEDKPTGPMIEWMDAYNQARHNAIYGNTDVSNYQYQTVEEYDAEIAKLEKQYDGINGYNYVYDHRGSGPVQQGREKRASKKKAIKAEIDGLKAQRNLLERAIFIGNKYGYISQSADFDTKSGVVRNDGDANYRAVNADTYDSLYPAVIDSYGFVDGQWVTDENADELAKKYGWDRFEKSNRIAASVADQQKETQEKAALGQQKVYAYTDWLTDDERKVYNYLYNTSGARAANAYLDDMKHVLEQRYSTAEQLDIIDKYNKSGDFGKVVMNIATIPANLVGAVVAAINDVSEGISGNYSPYGTAHSLQNYADTIRGQTATDINEAVKNAGGSDTIAQLASTLYQAGMSGADAMLGGVTLGSGYLFVAGANAATHKAKELYESGAEGWQIAVGSVASGVIEAAIEKLPLDNLLAMKNAGGADNLSAILKNILKQSGLEGTEEAITELANLAADCVLQGGNSDLSRQIAAYESEENSPEEARKMALRDKASDVLWATIAGMGSGGGSAAVFSTIGYGNMLRDTANLGKSILAEEGGLDKALAIGLDNARTTQAYKSALSMTEQALAGKGSSISPYQVGKMLRDSQTTDAQKARALDHLARQSGMQHNVEADILNMVADVAAGTGRQIVFGDLSEFDGEIDQVGGQYDPETGIITISPRATTEQVTNFLTKHEITHSIEGTQQWDQLANIVQAQLGDEAWSDAIVEVMERYAANGKELDLPGAEHEVVADWIGKNLYKSGFAQAIVNGDATVGNAFVQAIDKMRLALGNKKSRSHTNLAVVERLFMRALESEVQIREGGGEYAIIETTDGRYVAVVNNDVLKGINLSTWDKKTREVVKKAASDELKKFSNGFYINGVEFIGNKDTRDEYTRANYSEALAKKNPTAFRDKMRAANVLDEVVRVATNWKNDGQLTHPRTDYVDFVRGKALLMSGRRKYSVTVLAGVTGTGNVIFHDIVNVQPDSFTIKKSKIPTADTAKKSPHAILGISDGFSLSQPIANVKKKDIFGFTIDENANVDEDLLEELATYHPGAEVDTKGNVTVYHRTTSENAAQIKRSGVMYAKEDGVFFSTKADGYAADYGDTVVKLKIPSTVLRLNDVFDGEVHFDVPAKYRNGRFVLDVSRYLVENNSSSGQLSFLPPEMAENGKSDVYQEDGEREAYLADDERETTIPPSPMGDTSPDKGRLENGAIDENGELDEDALNRMVEERKRTKAEQAALEANRALLAQLQNGEISERTYLERVEDLRREAERAIDKKYRQGKRGSAEQKAAIKKLSHDVKAGLEENYRLKEAKLEAEHAERRERKRQRREHKEWTQLKNTLLENIAAMEQVLLHPNKNHAIPTEMIEPFLDITTSLESVFDDVDNRIEELQQRLRKETNPRKRVALQKRIKNLREHSDNDAAVMARLKSLYGDHMERNHVSDTYKPIAKMVEDALSMIGTRTIDGLSANEIQQLISTMQAMMYTASRANILHGENYTKSVQETGLQLEAEARENKILSTNWGSKLLTMQLDVNRFFDAMGGFAKNSAWKIVGQEALDGQVRSMEINRDFHNHFAEFIEDKKNPIKNLMSTKKNDLVDVGLVDIDGKPILMTRDMMLSLYQQLTCPANRQALMDGGLEIPDMNRYYNGDMVNAYKKGNGVRLSRSAYCEEIGETLEKIDRCVDDEAEYYRLVDRLTELEARASAEYGRIAENIEGLMTKTEKDYCDKVREWFDSISKKHINDVTMDVFGFRKAIVKQYYPIYRDTNFVATDFEKLVMNATLENTGSLKERVRSKAPVKIAGITDVLMHSEQTTARYCGFLKFTVDMNRLLNVHTNDMKHSVKDTLDNMTNTSRIGLGVTPLEYIENLMADIANARKSENSFISALRRNAIRATMTANVRVAIKQVGAVFTSAGELGWKYQSKAVQRIGRKVDPAMVAKYSVYFHERMYGNGGMEEFAAMKDGSNIFDRLYRKMDEATNGKLFNWCQDMDNAVSKLLWHGCEAKISDTRPELKHGTEEFYQAVGAELDRVIQKTQTNYTLMERSDLSRDTRWTMKILSTYKTDAIQGFNMLFEANARLRRYKKDLAAGTGGVTQADVDDAKQKLADTIPAVLVGNVLWGAFVGILINVLMQRTSGVRDDNGEITAASIGNALLTETLSGMAGMVVFGDQVYDIAAARIFGDNYYGISDMGVETIGRLLEDFATGNLTNAKTIKHLVQDLSKVIGIPVKNVWDVGEGIAKHIEDISKGEFLSFNADANTTTTQYYRRLYKAMQKGDTEKASEIREFLITCGKSESEIQSGLRAAVKKTDKDYKKAFDAAMREAVEDMFYRAMSEKEQKKVASGISGYIADQIVMDKNGGELTKANQKATEYIEKGASVAEYFVANTAKNAEFADKNQDGKVSKAEYRAVMSEAEYNEYLKRLLMGLK